MLTFKKTFIGLKEAKKDSMPSNQWYAVCIMTNGQRNRKAKKSVSKFNV